MISAVIDTNIFVSALFFKGRLIKIFELIQKSKIVPCFIPATLRELDNVLNHEKFSVQRARLSFSTQDFLEKLKRFGQVFPQPEIKLKVLKDNPGDNYILACALVAQAEFIVTGDKELLKLDNFERIPILTAQKFLKKFYH